MSEVDGAEQDRKALEALVDNNPDLERLEALLGRFNIFEAVGLVRQEIRHSAFLAFLLDPQESHRLRDSFVKRLLQEVIMSAPDTSAPVTPIELSLWDLDQIEVRREWQHVDIFLVDERNRLAVIIENKIDTGEHSDQLGRYHEVVKQHYPNCKVIGLYLTPAGDEPSHDAYLPLGYRLVCEVLDSLAESQASVSNPDLQVLVAHYTQMLRRHIVGDSEIAKLCQQIYEKHREAIDLISRYRPNTQAEIKEIKEILEDLVNSESELVLDRSSKTMTNFVNPQWDMPHLLTAVGWTSSQRVLLFQFNNNDSNLNLEMFIGPGSEEVRRKLFKMAQSNPDTFEVPRNIAKKHNRIYSRSFLIKDMYEDADYEERRLKIQRCWTEFLEEDLPKIDTALRQERWIWELNGGEEPT